MKVTNRVLVLLYRAWSEEYWCAGFIKPDQPMVSQFREWLRRELPQESFDRYEQQMLDEYWAQEAVK